MGIEATSQAWWCLKNWFTEPFGDCSLRRCGFHLQGRLYSLQQHVWVCILLESIGGIQPTYFFSAGKEIRILSTKMHRNYGHFEDAQTQIWRKEIHQWMAVSSAEFGRDGWGIESTGNMMNSALMLSKNHQFYAAKNGIFTSGHGCSPAMNSTKNQKVFEFLVSICLLHPNFTPFVCPKKPKWVQHTGINIRYKHNYQSQ